MPVIDFAEYLKKFKPVKRTLSSEYHLPSLRDKDSVLEGRLDFLVREVRDIYFLINQDLSKKTFIDFGHTEKFKSKLENLKTNLHHYCDTVCSPTRSNLQNLDKSGQQIFSELLQHLFMYVSDKYPDNKEYVNKIMGEILTNHADDFFSFLGVSRVGKEVCLWRDPIQGETALISVLRDGEIRIVRSILERLKISFFGEGIPITEIPSAFENYLFHETGSELSALSITWKRDNPEILQSLLEFAQSIYGSKDTPTFQRFIFQLDQHGTTSLMRATYRKDLSLVRLILDGMRKVYEAPTHSIFRSFLQYQDSLGFTAFNRASQMGKSKIVHQLIDTATIAFGGRKTDEFKKFLNLPNKKGTSPFISAAINSHAKVLQVLFVTAHQAYGERSEALRQFIFHQDNDGFTALMRVVEHNQVGDVEDLLGQLMHLSDRLENSSNALYEAFRLRTNQRLSVFHLAVQNRSTETLVALLRGLHLIFDGGTPEFRGILSQLDGRGLTPLDRVIEDEKLLIATLESEGRVASLKPQEKVARLKRAQMAGEFLAYGIKPSIEANIPFLKRFAVRSSSWLLADFFSIFCPVLPVLPGRWRVTRAISCRFDKRDYQSSFPEEPRQMRQEALVNLVAFLKQANLNSIAEVAFIRNLDHSSPREQRELQKYSRAVDQYDAQYSQQILRQFKQQTVTSLENGLSRLSGDYPYLLLDNGNDLLVLGKEHIFSGALLSPTQGIDLRPGLSSAVLQDWLASYFGRDYTVHPFDPEILNVYPDPLESLNVPILSDEKFLSEELEGLSRKTIQTLFLLDKASIQINNFDEGTDFLSILEKRLSFRAENFHEVFFKLTLAEKIALKNLLLTKNFLTAQYSALSDSENQYLTLYKTKLVNRFRGQDIESITPIELLHDAIEVQEYFLDRESEVFSSVERQQIKASLQQLKMGLTKRNEKNQYGKAALQLVVLLFPNAIRGIVNKDPMEALTPAALIAADVGLRKLLVGFAKHPHVMKLFSHGLASKVLAMTSETAERIPMIGSAFALYGLYESGKALAATTKNDPNRPYYAHLFLNNLVMVGLMGAELVVALPFWPVLALFALLTVDQSLTAGGRIHDIDLHLTDDKGHPFVKFLTELELGLGIVNSRVELVETQRVLFQAFLAYLDYIQNENNLYKYIAVSLPEVLPAENFKYSDKRNGQRVNYNEPTRIIQKNEFNFQLGEFKAACELDDAYYLNGQNYTLLTGQWVAETDCKIGQSKTRLGSAKASGTAGAAIVINQQATKHQNGLLLPIDPAWVKYYGVDWRQSMGINTIVVNIAAIYRMSYRVLYRVNADEITTINVQAKLNNRTAPAIQYLLGVTKGVVIVGNTIPNKTFAFFDKDNALRFENDTIRAENGFKAVLGGTQVLVLAFDKGVTVQGEVPVTQNRRVVISHLQGIDEKRLAFFNATKCHSFTVSLGQQTEFVYQEQVLRVIASNSSYWFGMINVYKEAGMSPFYYFTEPFNYVSHNMTQSNGISLAINSSANSPLVRVHVIDNKNGDKVEPPIFSGHYIAESGEKFYSRLLVGKSQDRTWESVLEINASTSNVTQELDISEIQAQNFSKVSILTKEGDGSKLTHYVDWRRKSLPQIRGHFVNYQLENKLGNYVLVLVHTENHEETRIFLAKENSGIVINDIHYQPNWTLFTLLAINGVDGLPIDGDYLLAPIKIEKAFNETTLSQANDSYTIGGIAIKNPSNKLIFYYADVQVPFAVLVYQAKINMVRLVNRPTYAHYKAAGQSLVSDYKISEKEALPNNSTWNVTYYFGVAAGVAGGVLGTGLMLFSKRFRTSRQAVVAGQVAASVAVPSLEMQTVNTVSMESKKDENLWAEYNSSFQEDFSNCPALRYVDYEGNAHQNKTSDSAHELRFIAFRPEKLNSDIMLARCLGQLLPQPIKNLAFNLFQGNKSPISINKKVVKVSSYKSKDSFFIDKSSTVNTSFPRVTSFDSQPINRNHINSPR